MITATKQIVVEPVRESIPKKAIIDALWEEYEISKDEHVQRVVQRLIRFVQAYEN